MYSYVNFAYGATFGLNLYCFLLYCFLLLCSLRGNVVNLYVKESNRGAIALLFCGILLFSMTAFVSDDFFHYYEEMFEYRGRVFGDQETGFEAFYQYLISFIDGDYFLFRLVVWGGSLVLTIYAIRNFGANVYHTLFLILAGFIITFSYARATLAMAVFSFGFVLVSISSERKLKDKVLLTIVGFAILSCSIFFHRSMLPMLVVAFCWVIMPWKRFLAKYSLWLFPIFVAICAVILKNAFEELFVVANAIEDETGLLNKAETYKEQEQVVHNINGYIRLGLHYATFFFPILLASWSLRSEQNLNAIGKKGIWLYQMVFLIAIFATSFTFLNIDSSVLFYRYLYMSFIPLSILIAYMKDLGVLSKTQYLWIVAVFVLSNLFQLFAAVYSKA